MLLIAQSASRTVPSRGRHTIPVSDSTNHKSIGNVAFQATKPVFCGKATNSLRSRAGAELLIFVHFNTGLSARQASASRKPARSSLSVIPPLPFPGQRRLSTAFRISLLERSVTAGLDICGASHW
jgi:hypothetical protein